MALKLLLEESDWKALPEPVQKEYVSKDGKYTLDVEGGVEPASRVKEFRDRNISLDTELTTLKKAYNGIDPEKYATLTKREKELMDGEVYKKDGLDKAVESRTATMRTEYDGKLTEAGKKIELYEGELARLKLDGGAAAEGARLNIEPEYLDMVTALVRNVFRMEDGAPVAYVDGKLAYGADGQKLTIKEFMEGLQKTKPKLFKPSTGAGTGGSGQAGGDTGENPWKKETFNRTKQMAIMGTDMPKARRLAAQAGTTIRE